MSFSEFGRKNELFCRPSVKKASLQERVRHRLQELVSGQDVSHEVLGRYLGLSRSAVSRMLNDPETGIGLHHIERLCEFFQITPAELMVDPGSLIQPLTPIEAAIVNIVRKMNELHRHSLLSVLDWQRGSSETRKRPGRTPDHLSPEDAMVLSLYRGMEDTDAQSGIVMQMRGYVQARREKRTVKARGETP